MDSLSFTPDQLKHIWDEVLAVLKMEVSKVQYETYIEPLVLEDISDETAHICVPHDFYISILESKYYDRINSLLINKTKKYMTLKFHLTGTYKRASIENEIFEAPVFISHLNPKYTFDSFIIGNCNRMAYAAAVAISTSPGYAYNPLFIYGNSGLGKTHLMHAIGNEILKNDSSKKILYVTSETFTNEFVDALQHKKNDEFRNKYRRIDVLLIDDIQFISNRERTQEEFFNTFNTLYEEKKQIVISCDSPLNKVDILEERLRTRFAWGLIVDIQVPDFETKVAILSKKASESSLEVENEILDYIASYTGDNIRELEGVINHFAISISQGREITLALAKESMKHLQNNNVHEVTTSVIIDVVSRYFNISVDDILSKKRNKELVFPRQISMYLCRQLTDLSFPKIGETFNGRDHSTVMHACEQIADQVDRNPELTKMMEEINNNIMQFKF